MSEELAARCEAARGPDGDIDQDIDELVCTGVIAPDPEKRPRPFAPRYTASIDAAMTLVPAGMVLRRYVTTRYVPHSCEVSVRWAYGGWEGSSDHSFALALCAAALKARQL